MSIHTITCDEFMQLTASHHRLAIRLFTAEINSLIAYLAEHPEAADHAKVNDELLEAMQLRKVHQTRLDEMVEDSADNEKRRALASEQYAFNESNPTLVS